MASGVGTVSSMDDAKPLVERASTRGKGRRRAVVLRLNFATKDMKLITHLEGALAYFVCSRVMRRWRASHSSSGNRPFATVRNFLYRSDASLAWCSLSCAVAARNSAGGGPGSTLGTNPGAWQWDLGGV